MINRRPILLGAVASTLAPLLRQVRADTVTEALGPAPSTITVTGEPPVLAEMVAKGSLPPMVDRLPTIPRLIEYAETGRQPGVWGGAARMLMGDSRDIRYITIYSYARLVGFNARIQIRPDILESLDVDGDRVFTLNLRPGHRWSDGHPFTAEDFRYWWEDMANNKRLNPGGPPVEMVIGGKKPRFEVLSETSVRYAWDEPNPSFLPALANAMPLYIQMPAHYLKQFHQKYADPKALAALVAKTRVRDWGALHDRMSRAYRPENPDLPSLEAWVNTTKPPADLYVFRRNPYYHRVDPAGRQLPYLDEIHFTIASPSLIPAKVASGEADLQARYLDFDHYTLVKEAEARNHYRVLLWKRGEGSQMVLAPNLNATDPVWRDVFRNVLVRRALSLAINRDDINRVIFFGLATPAANTVLPESPLYTRGLSEAYAQYDPARANALLDEAGFTKRDTDGVRLLADGRRFEFIVETTGESPAETDMLELVSDDWLAIGVRIHPRATPRNAFRRKITEGTTVMAVWQGYDDGLAGPDNAPDELAPSSQMQLQWPKWGLWAETGGHEGEKIDDPAASQLFELHRAWRHSSATHERREIWRQMLEIEAEQVFTIGIVSGTLQPLVVSRQMRNVPEHGVYSFQPGAFLGIYQPDTFWLDPTGQEA